MTDPDPIKEAEQRRKERREKIRAGERQTVLNNILQLESDPQKAQEMLEQYFQIKDKMIAWSNTGDEKHDTKVVNFLQTEMRNLEENLKTSFRENPSTRNLTKAEIEEEIGKRMLYYPVVGGTMGGVQGGDEKKQLYWDFDGELSIFKWIVAVEEKMKGAGLLK